MQAIAKQVRINLWFYKRDLNILDQLLQKRKALANLKKALITFRNLVTYAALLNNNLRPFIENDEVISGITWELHYLDSEIENAKARIRWHKRQPIWIPLG